MKEIATSIEGLRLLEFPVFRDERGFFVEKFRQDKLSAVGINENFVQDNHSHSLPGVLRGLHYQTEPAQGKFVSALRGRIFDVAVDLRKNSATFGKWFGAELSESNGRALWIPFGFAHGFCVLGDQPADVFYKVNGFYNAQTEGGVFWNDPQIAIEWPLKNPLISPRDTKLPGFGSVRPL